MFKKHATFRIAGLRPLRPGQVMPHRTELAHANDNVRRLAARARRFRPKLACRWVFTDGDRLECCWEVESDGKTSTDAPDGRSTGSEPSGLRYASAHRLRRRISHNSL
jgi:hypothetical protein